MECGERGYLQILIKFRIVAALVFVLLYVLPVSGRESDDVLFYNLNREFDISVRETNEVCSDDYGFVWISSKMGIVRYSQDDVRIYQLPYETADIVSVGLVYMNGILYAYTNNGQIFRYDFSRDAFDLEINVAREVRNPHIMITRMLVDQQQRLWLGSSYGLYCYEPESGLTSMPQNEAIQFMEWFDEERFFYAIQGKVKLFNIAEFSSADYYNYPDDVNYICSYFHFDKLHETLWMGTSARGLFFIKPEGNELKFARVPEIPCQPVLAIEPNSDSTLLIGIDGQGIWEITLNGEQVLNIYKEDADNPNSLKGNGVYDIYRDQNNRIWVCTYSGGASFFDQANPAVTRISHIVNRSNSLVNDEVNKVLEDTDGNLWFATNNGLSFLEVATNRWKTYYRDNTEQARVFLSLCEDDRGRIWAGTYSSGVYLIDRKTGKQLAYFSPDDTGNDISWNFIFDIHKDTEGDIWIGGVGGNLIHYQSAEDKFRSYKNFTIRVMYDYDADYLLIGTTFGLQIVDKTDGKTQTLVQGYLVQDILLKDDVVWICTSGDGVLRYDMKDKSLNRFGVESGLPSNFANSIDFSHGYLWIGTEQGLCRLDEENKSIVTFNSFPDLANLSFNLNAHASLRDGRLIWGTSKGAVIFDPGEIHPRQQEGRIFFQDLSISGRSVREMTEFYSGGLLDNIQNLELKHFQNTLALELIPIGVSSPGSKFSWKMEGLDKEWSTPANSRILSYSSIPNGTYSLQIRMFDNSLTSVIAQRTIDLIVIPPLWKTWWFNLLVIVFIVGLSIFLFAFYISRLKKQNSDEKIRFFVNTAHEIRTSLTLISGPIEELNKEKGLSDKGMQYLNWATEQAQRLSKVVTQLMDFQRADNGKEALSLSMVNIVEIIENRVMMFESYAMSKNVELNFTANTSAFATAVDEAMIEKVVDNLISNAIKYSHPNSPVQIDLQCLTDRWILKVKDKGIGISKKAQRHLFNEYYRGENAVNSKIVGSGIGLLLVKNYVNQHDGKINCYSQLDSGSTFELIMPVKGLEVVVPEQDFSKGNEAQSLVFSNAATKAKPVENDSGTEQKMKVLIVEDHDHLREFLRSALDSHFQILLAKDGLQAWEMISKESPDLVVSDIMMPNMDGFELCKKMKSTWESSHIPIILLTALNGKAQQLHGLGLGADDYLVKPFDTAILQQRIRAIIRNREAIRNRVLKLIRIDNESDSLIKNEHNDRFLKKMVEIARDNISNAQFTKNEFASIMNVSPSLLYQKIKSLTDQSPSDFIRTIRLERSLELLKMRNYSITEVSELCGFKSVGYFSTVFKKHYGKSPTQIL